MYNYEVYYSIMLEFRVSTNKKTKVDKCEQTQTKHLFALDNSGEANLSPWQNIFVCTFAFRKYFLKFV